METTPKTPNIGRKTNSPFELSEESKIQKRANYCQRIDRIVQEYDCGNLKQSDPIDEGYLSFIGFGKQNKRKGIRSRSNSRESHGNLGWFFQTFKSIIGL